MIAIMAIPCHGPMCVPRAGGFPLSRLHGRPRDSPGKRPHDASQGGPERGGGAMAAAAAFISS